MCTAQAGQGSGRLDWIISGLSADRFSASNQSIRQPGVIADNPGGAAKFVAPATNPNVRVARSDCLSKRVLIIGYWYGVETMGGVRLRRIARFLPQYGWEPVILMPPKEAASGAALPPGIRSEEVAAPDL